MKTVCIVQARMGSKRLPGKVLLPLNGRTVIGEVLLRCNRIAGVHKVVCAIPDTPENDKLAKVAQLYSEVHRGPEGNVLERYYQAAVAHEADIVVRVTGDCPLLCPGVCAGVIRFREDNSLHYAATAEWCFPKGYDCEVFTRDLLINAKVYATGAYDREHVTPWMKGQLYLAPSDPTLIERGYYSTDAPMDGRLTLDTEDDYKVICAAFGHAPYQRLRAA